MVVDLLRYFALVDQQLVAVEIVLRFHVIRLSLYKLGMGRGHLPLSGDDSGVSVFDAGRSELQLA